MKREECEKRTTQQRSNVCLLEAECCWVDHHHHHFWHLHHSHIAIIFIVPIIAIIDIIANIAIININDVITSLAMFTHELSLSGLLQQKNIQKLSHMSHQTII